MGRYNPAMNNTLVRTLLWVVSLCALPAAYAANNNHAAKPAITALDSQLAQILQLFPGRYSGEANDPADASGKARLTLYHKIARINAPQFGGDAVYYHQISRDGFDSPQPLQQKIYAFDRSPVRKANSMRAFVFPLSATAAHLQDDPAAALALQPGKLMVFPAACDIRWAAGSSPGVYRARVRRGDCSYDSVAFKQKISPDLTYELSGASFAMEDVLFGADGNALFPSSGLLTTPRVSAPPGTAPAIIEAAVASEWRSLEPDNSLYLELSTGRVVFELASQFAPLHVANIRTLVRERFFDGLSINRVQDNFVAQWGDPNDPPTRSLGTAAHSLAPEFTRDWSKTLPFTALPDHDGFAAAVGFSSEFPVAGDRPGGQIGIAHCYGVLGVGRDTPVESGSGAELYVVIGHAPRQLDRNVAVVGRVVEGIEKLSTLARGTGPLGFYTDAAQRVPIRSLRIGSELPVSERVDLQILRTDSESFALLVEARRNRRDDWYKHPAGYIDLCSVPLPVRKVQRDSARASPRHQD